MCLLLRINRQILEIRTPGLESLNPDGVDHFSQAIGVQTHFLGASVLDEGLNGSVSKTSRRTEAKGLRDFSR